MTESLPQRSPEWHEARRGKMTASNLGASLGQVGYVSRPQAFRRAMGLDTFEGNEATDWGTLHEENGIKVYEKLTRNVVQETGLHVHPEYGWLAGSPDGLVGCDGLIEVKCPFYKRRPHQDVPGHYWMQCNALMEITRREWCDYICWTPGGVTIQRIPRDSTTFNWLLPYYANFYAAMKRGDTVPPSMPKDTRELISSKVDAARRAAIDQWEKTVDVFNIHELAQHDAKRHKS